MNKITTTSLLLRVAIAIVLFAHSIPGMFDGGVNTFGNLYLNEVGFAPLGVPIAWAIKGSHVVCAILLLLNKYIKWACIPAIFVLVMGIILVHWQQGWFVVGGGRNGVEYNFILICVLLYIMITDHYADQPGK
jgi:putative oxidoreductase